MFEVLSHLLHSVCCPMENFPILSDVHFCLGKKGYVVVVVVVVVVVSDVHFLLLV